MAISKGGTCRLEPRHFSDWHTTVWDLICGRDSRRVPGQKGIQDEKRGVSVRRISLQEAVGLGVTHHYGRFSNQGTKI